MTDTKPIGLIGLGLLGQALAQRVAGASFGLVGYDIDPAKTAALVKLGGQSASSIAEVAKRSAPIILAVFSTDQAKAIAASEPERGSRVAIIGSSCGRLNNP